MSQYSKPQPTACRLELCAFLRTASKSARGLNPLDGTYSFRKYAAPTPPPDTVLTSRTDHDVTDPGITFLTGELEEAVETARGSAGEKNLEIFGANVAAQCLDRGLIDEIVVHLAPVLLGDGVRLYGEAGSRAQVDLELTDRAESGELQSLRFRVKG